MADYLLGEGLPAGQILSVPGRGKGGVLSGTGFTVTALHAFHLDIGLTDTQALRAAQAAFDAEFAPPPTASDRDSGGAISDEERFRRPSRSSRHLSSRSPSAGPAAMSRSAKCTSCDRPAA
jgi:hypothetical protein